MSLRRRVELLRWASSAQAWVVEDDYDSEFRYSARPIPCLHGLDVDGRVVYVGTFAKTLFPALRLGFLIVPKAITNLVRSARRAGDVHAPMLEQAVLADFMMHGHYATHLRRTAAARGRFGSARGWQRYCGGTLTVRAHRTGLHVVADLHGAEAGAVAAAAAREGLEVLPLSVCYASRRLPANALVLGFGCVRSDDMADAMRRLAIAIDSAARARSAAG
jgi:GntR family transcriptional regulator/MocR family aminotransferase